MSKLGGEIPGDGEEFTVTAHAEDMVLVPRAELDALRAEIRRLRHEAWDHEALERIQSDSGKSYLHSRGTGRGLGN
jgi:hypothetical protein